MQVHRATVPQMCRIWGVIWPNVAYSNPFVWYYLYISHTNVTELANKDPTPWQAQVHTGNCTKYVMKLTASSSRADVNKLS